MKYRRLKKFLNKNKINFLENENLLKYNSMKINSISKIFIKIFKIQELEKLIKYMKLNNIKYYLLGNGSNILFVDKIIKRPIIKLCFEDSITINNSFVLVNANMLNIKFSNYLKNEGYSNFEFLSVIPGSIGGGLYMNASCFGNSFSDNLLYVEVVDEKGKIRWIDQKDIEFKYRYSSLSRMNVIITRAIFKLNRSNKKDIDFKINEFKKMKSDIQPLEYPSCGSVFKNNKLKAYEYIIGAGLSGFLYKGAMISLKHANFIINYNNASGKSVLFIIEKILKKVYDKYKVHLELEITLIRS